MAKGSSNMFRFVGLLVIAALGAVLVVPPIKERRSERRIRAMLLAMQEGLQKYHVEEELYPKQMMSGSELAKLLSENDFLGKEVQNPWTGESYEDSDRSDWLRYKTDGLAETYELIVYFPESEKEQFRLDSTENQSLEE